MVSNLKQELETTKSELNNLTSKFKTSLVDPIKVVKSVNQSCGNFEIHDIKDKELKALQKQAE
jgi:hypothetical protein